MAYCRALVPFQRPDAPQARLKPLLEQLGLVVEQPDPLTLTAYEHPGCGGRVNDAVRIWADWRNIASTGELWLEALSGEGHGRPGSRCAAMLERIRAGLSR